MTRQAAAAAVEAPAAAQHSSNSCCKAVHASGCIDSILFAAGLVARNGTTLLILQAVCQHWSTLHCFSIGQ
jgi:hypothetical protein